MIYAVIIIASLAVAFIILVRRLPEAIDHTHRSRSTDRLARTETASPANSQSKKPSWQMPTFTLPSVNLPSRQPHTSEAAKETPKPIETNAPKPSGSGFKMPSFKLPDFGLHKSNPSAPQPHSSAPAPTDSLGSPTKNHGDFWAGSESAKEAPKPTPEPILPKPTFIERPKGRDQFQEAEDLFAIKDYKKAEKLYLRLATTDPKNSKIYSRLGIIYLEQENYDDARDALQQALKLEPGNASRHFNLALVYMNLGSQAKAVASMEAALKYDPSNRKYRKMLDDILAGRA